MKDIIIKSLEETSAAVQDFRDALEMVEIKQREHSDGRLEKPPSRPPLVKLRRPERRRLHR